MRNVIETAFAIFEADVSEKSREAAQEPSSQGDLASVCRDRLCWLLNSTYHFRYI